MFVHHSFTFQRPPGSDRITVERRVRIFIPIAQHRIKETPGGFDSITAGKECRVALNSVFNQAGISIARGASAQLVVTEVHHYLLHIESRSGNFHAEFQHNTLVGLQAED